VGFIDASTEASLSEMVMGGDMSVPRPWPYAIAIEEKIIVTSSSVSEAEYRFRMLYMADASAK
jgi:hypothetical protein